MAFELIADDEKTRQLRDSEGRLGLLFEKAPDPYFLANLKGTFIDGNEAAEELTGYPREELIGKSFLKLKLLSSKQIAKASTLLARNALGKDTGPEEFILTRKDGKQVPVEIRTHPVKIHGKQVVLGLVRDITERKRMEERIVHLNAVLRAIRKVNQLIVKEKDRNRLLKAACKNLVETRGYYNAWIALLDQSGKLVTTAEAGLGNKFLPLQERWKAGELPHCARAALAKPGVSVIEDPPTICWDCPLAGAYVGRWGLTCRLESGGNIYGLLTVSVTPDYAADEEGQSLFGEVAGDIGFALHSMELERERKQAEEALRQSSQKIERLHQIAHDLETCKDEDQVYRLTVEAAERTLSFSVCTLDIVEEDRLVVKATSSASPPAASQERELKEGGLAAKTYRTKETTVFGRIEDVREATSVREDIRSGISAPIGDIGVFQAVSTEPDAFTKNDAHMIDLLLGHTYEAIRRIRLQEDLKHQAIHDPLTGAYNRRHLDQTIETELQRSKRYDHPIGFLMIDIDRFKEINDRFGHQMGNKVLQAVAELLSDQVRETDLVIRYGGDEFLIVLIETNGELQMITKRIQQAVAKRNKENPLLDFPVTLSIGAAHWEPKDDLTIEQVLASADERMYQEKKRSTN